MNFEQLAAPQLKPLRFTGVKTRTKYEYDGVKVLVSEDLDREEDSEEEEDSEATQAYEGGSDFDEDEKNDIMYQGVPYKVDRDKDVTDPNDFSCLGTWDEETEEITFNGENEKAAHKLKVK